jgi:hypothetical protein
MSLSIDGFWKAGFWSETFWAAGFWYEGAPVTPPAPAPSGGVGRYIGHLPHIGHIGLKPKVKVKWTDDHERELTALLKRIDSDYERKRREQLDELLAVLRQAVYIGREVSISGFEYLTESDLIAAKRKIQEDEAVLLLLDI